MKRPNTFTPSGAQHMVHELAFSLARKAIIKDLGKEIVLVSEGKVNKRAKAMAHEFISEARIKLRLDKPQAIVEPVPPRMSVSQALERLRRAGK